MKKIASTFFIVTLGLVSSRLSKASETAISDSTEVRPFFADLYYGERACPRYSETANFQRGIAINEMGWGGVVTVIGVGGG